MSSVLEDYVNALCEQLRGKTIKRHFYVSSAETLNAWRAKPCTLCPNPASGDSPFCEHCQKDGSAWAYIQLMLIANWLEEQQKLLNRET